MKPGDAAKLLGLGRSTLTVWTSDPPFIDFFSPSAQGGSGRPRNLTDHDLRVLHFISEARQENMRTEEIVANLQQIQQDGWEGLPDIPEAPVGMASVPMMPTAAAEMALSSERKAMFREVAILQEQITGMQQQLALYDTRFIEQHAENKNLIRQLAQAETQLKFLQETAISIEEARELIERATKAETELAVIKGMQNEAGPDEIEILSKRLEEAQEARIALAKEISEAQTELRLYRTGRLKPEEGQGDA